MIIISKRGIDKRTRENKERVQKIFNELLNEEKLKILYYDNIPQNYIVSSKGVIFSLHSKNGYLHPRMPYMDRDGHLKVTLNVVQKNGNKISRHFFIHRLVAEAFVPNPDITNKKSVHHIDGDEMNNDMTNLMWVSHKEHCQLTKSLNQYIGLSGELNSSSIYTNEQILEVLHLLEQNELYMDEISEKTGVSISTIQHIIHRPNSWKYLKKDFDISKYNKSRRCVYTPEQYNRVVEIFSNPYRPSIKKIADDEGLSYSMLKKWHQQLINQGVIPHRIKV